MCKDDFDNIEISTLVKSEGNVSVTTLEGVQSVKGPVPRTLFSEATRTKYLVFGDNESMTKE